MNIDCTVEPEVVEQYDDEEFHFYTIKLIEKVARKELIEQQLDRETQEKARENIKYKYRDPKTGRGYNNISEFKQIRR